METHNDNIPQQGNRQNPAERNTMPERKDEQWEGDAHLSKTLIRTTLKMKGETCRPIRKGARSMAIMTQAKSKTYII